MELKTVSSYDGYSGYSGQNERFSNRTYMTVEGLDILHNADYYSENKLAAGDRVYFSTLSSVPRYKFSEYCKDKDISRVINFKKCNTYVVGTNLNENFLPQNTTESAHKNKHVVYVSRDVFMNKTGIHVPSGIDTVYVNNRAYDQQKRLIADLFKGYPTEQLISADYVFNQKNIKEANNLVEEIRTVRERGIKIVTDEFINKQINQGVTIDEDVAKGIREMFNSRQKDNIGLAMEIMANSHYEESELQLMMLLHDYNSVISQHKNRNLVNFRGLTDYFKDFDWHAGDKDFIKEFAKALKKRGLLEEKKKMLEEAALRYIKQSTSYWEDLFKVNVDISFKE